MLNLVLSMLLSVSFRVSIVGSQQAFVALVYLNDLGCGLCFRHSDRASSLSFLDLLAENRSLTALQKIRQEMLEDSSHAGVRFLIQVAGDRGLYFCHSNSVIRRLMIE
jgi:hypothetical protein